MNKAFLYLVFAVGVLIQCEGCTIVGGVVGAGIDLAQPADTLSFAAIHAIQLGDTITVGLKKRNFLRGTFVLMEELNDSVYGIRYNSTASHLDSVQPTGSTVSRLPRIGEAIRIRTSGGWANPDREGIFRGFAMNDIEFVSSPAPTMVEHVPIADAVELRDSSGALFDRNAIAAALKNGDIPSRNVIQLKTRDGVVSVRGEDIAYVYQYHSGYHYLNGLGIGLLADAAFVTFVLITQHGHLFEMH